MEQNEIKICEDCKYVEKSFMGGGFPQCKVYHLYTMLVFNDGGPEPVGNCSKFVRKDSKELININLFGCNLKVSRCSS